MAIKLERPELRGEVTSYEEIGNKNGASPREKLGPLDGIRGTRRTFPHDDRSCRTELSSVLARSRDTREI